MENNVQEIVWVIEEKVADTKVRNNHAVNAVRNAQCLRNDFRTYNVVREAFNYLTASFKKYEGMVMMTNACMKLGGIYSRNLNIEAGAKLNMQFGTLILNALIDNNYLILEREPFFTFEEIIEDKKKRTLRLQPYHLELGYKFHDIQMDSKVRNGISLRRYPRWEGTNRVVDGVQDRLIKSSVDTVNPDAPYVEAINNLEAVKWSINPQVAKVSEFMREEIIDTRIRLDKGVIFDARDIRRENLNERHKGKDLFRDGALFNPEKGSARTVKTIEDKITEIERKLKKLSEGGVAHKNAVKELRSRYNTFEKHNLNWLAKQLCLSTQSKALRDSAILNTMHGSDGWASYNFHLGMFLDFRGRVYARDAFFSYQSSDLARGHLMFAEKKLMTERGYEHLLVHIANSYNQSYTVDELKSLDWLETDYVTGLVTDGILDMSVDKMSRTDRIRWADEHLSMFSDVAEAPNGYGRMIWGRAEKRWIFLSLCFEITAYWESLGKGEEYLSQIPIAIDGSSNGTQHLAAMSKDEVAGKMVGLVPMDKPIDFYVVVAKGILNRNIGSDLGAILAKIPMKLMRKGISKRGTMTKAYDAGVKCIADIIYKDCYDAKMTTKYGITKAIARKLSEDLVDTYNSICEGPVDIKNYLQALVIHQMETDDFITWQTPSGFNVISEKYVSRQIEVKLVFTEKRIGAVIREYTDYPARHELTSGISPNWVHSMDASHMSLVINELNKLGITSFGAIHDSFSVHAEDVDDLLYVTKDTFIDMYSGDVFKEMKEQIVGVNSTFAEAPPKKGKLDLSKVMLSDYFFS